MKQRLKPTKSLPPSYMATGHVDLGRAGAALAANLVGLAFFFIFGWFFVELGRAVRPEAISGDYFALIGRADALMLLLALVATLLLHESIHGLGFWLLTRSRPKFGIHFLYAYAAAPEWYLPRNRFIVVGLAPLLIITLLGLIALPFVPAADVPILLTAITLNTAGSIGDIIVAGWLLTHRPELLAQDSGPSVRIFEPQPSLETKMQQRWLNLMATFEVDPAAARAIFDDLADHYRAPDRHYHTLGHIEQLLDIAASLKPLARDYQAIQLAIWFHDIIYDPRARDNEVRSAEYAGRHLNHLGMDQDMIAEVQRLIMVTIDHQAEEGDIDAQIVIDADLSPLGAEEATFERQSQALRREFSWVPDDLYQAARLQVLSGFLNRERIFNTEALFAQREEQARHNLTRAIQKITTGAGRKAN